MPMLIGLILASIPVPGAGRSRDQTASVSPTALSGNPSAAASGTAPRAASLRSSRAFHIRTLDRRIDQWIESGIDRSPTFRVLIGRIGQSDVIAHAEIVERLPRGDLARLVFISSVGHHRYVRIQLVTRPDADEMVALLAHELQHLLEVADTPRVRDNATLAQLYREIGHEWRNGAYESFAAVRVGHQVGRELAVRQVASIGRE
jgi:hypothetical protein